MLAVGIVLPNMENVCYILTVDLPNLKLHSIKHDGHLHKGLQHRYQARLRSNVGYVL